MKHGKKITEETDELPGGFSILLTVKYSFDLEGMEAPLFLNLSEKGARCVRETLKSNIRRAVKTGLFRKNPVSRDLFMFKTENGRAVISATAVLAYEKPGLQGLQPEK